MKTQQDSGKVAKPRGRPRSFDREAALERAIEVFWKHGYEATSISDLTQAMGINPPSLYAAFGDKEKLFLEAIDRYQARRGETAGRAFDEEPTAKEAVSRLLMEMTGALCCPDSPRGCMLVMSTVNCSDASLHVQEALAAKRAAMNARLKARIDRAVSEGELARDTDTGALADFYAVVIQGMSLQARDGASQKRLIAAAEAAMRAWPEQKNTASQKRRVAEPVASAPLRRR